MLVKQSTFFCKPAARLGKAKGARSVCPVGTGILARKLLLRSDFSTGGENCFNLSCLFEKLIIR
jgi:hypothetical protein